VSHKEWIVLNPSGTRRVIVTKQLPGRRWTEILAKAGCRLEIYTAADALTGAEIKAAIGERCDGAIGQLTERWGEEAFAALRSAGGKVYSNYAVGYDNVDLGAATKNRIAVGNTPGVLTEATAEMAVALTFAAARRIVEADAFMRSGQFTTWLPTLFIGRLLWRKKLGVIGAGRIGSAYARMMLEGHKMDLIYHSRKRNIELEDHIETYNSFLEKRGEQTVVCEYAEKVEDLLRKADVVSLHTALDASTRHLIDAERLAQMKADAILINTGRGPLIDESALVEHCRKNPEFRAALDVFEDEPAMKAGLADLSNVVIVPHIGSATRWSREGMAILAAGNVAGILMGYRVWRQPDISPFLADDPPKAAPSILNSKELGMAFYSG